MGFVFAKIIEFLLWILVYLLFRGASYAILTVLSLVLGIPFWILTGKNLPVMWETWTKKNYFYGPIANHLFDDPW